MPPLSAARICSLGAGGALNTATPSGASATHRTAAGIADISELPFSTPIMSAAIRLKCRQLLRKEEVKPDAKKNACQQQEGRQDHRRSAKPMHGEPIFSGAGAVFNRQGRDSSQMQSTRLSLSGDLFG
jgi:hypothetical protein